MTKIRNLFFKKRIVGTPEWLINKWTKKISKAYRYYGEIDGDFILPSILRVDFERDINKVIELRIKELFPEKSLLGTISDPRRK